MHLDCSSSKSSSLLKVRLQARTKKWTIIMGWVSRMSAVWRTLWVSTRASSRRSSITLLHLVKVHHSLIMLRRPHSRQSRLITAIRYSSDPSLKFDLFYLSDDQFTYLLTNQFLACQLIQKYLFPQNVCSNIVSWFSLLKFYQVLMYWHSFQ